MAVIAKFRVESVDKNDAPAPGMSGHCFVRLEAVDHGPFWEATPCGRMEMSITNREAYEQFAEGDVFLLTFEKEEETFHGN